MEWTALSVSLRLAGLTCLLLLPAGLWLGRALALSRFRGRALCEALVALPLVMPPTVLGFYLMQAFGEQAPFGAAWQSLTGGGLNFTFTGILLASLVANLPFAVQPIQRAFETIPPTCARPPGAAASRRPRHYCASSCRWSGRGWSRPWRSPSPTPSASSG